MLIKTLGYFMMRGKDKRVLFLSHKRWKIMCEKMLSVHATDNVVSEANKMVA